MLCCTKIPSCAHYVLEQWAQPQFGTQSPERVNPVLSTYVNPAQSDEVILVLDEEELLLVFSVTVVRPAGLLRDDDVGHGEGIPVLEN